MNGEAQEPKQRLGAGVTASLVCSSFSIKAGILFSIKAGIIHYLIRRIVHTYTCNLRVRCYAEPRIAPLPAGALILLPNKQPPMRDISIALCYKQLKSWNSVPRRTRALPLFTIKRQTIKSIVVYVHVMVRLLIIVLKVDNGVHHATNTSIE